MAQHPSDNRPWPTDGLERVEQCPICGNPNRSLLYEGLIDKIFFCAPGQWSLYRCTDCGSAYLDPRPTPATIGLAYNAYYTHEEPNDTPKGWIGRLKRGLRNGYLNDLYRMQLRPAHKAGGWIIPLLPQKRRIDESVRHLPPDCKPGNLVDIGCGNGEFLQIARALGWETWGIDLDPKAVETALKTGATVTQGGLPDTGLPSERFDVVTLSHVIEHVHDPLATLKEIFRILKPGGQIWLATPNLNSFGHARFRSDWRGLEPPRHLVLFTRASVEHALRATNFIDIHHKPCRPQATEFYQNSYRISLGGAPNFIRGSLPLTLRFSGFIADIITFLSSSRCENIVLTAARPPIQTSPSTRPQL